MLWFENEPAEGFISVLLADANLRWRMEFFVERRKDDGELKKINIALLYALAMVFALSVLVSGASDNEAPRISKMDLFPDKTEFSSYENIILSVVVSDDTSLSSIEYYIDNNLMDVQSISGTYDIINYEFEYGEPGRHTLMIKVIDYYENVTSGSVSFRIVEKEAEEFYVYYDANGGTNAPEPQLIAKNGRFTIPKEEPELEGRKFLGWSTDYDSVYAKYKSSSSYKSEENLYLFAVWELNEQIYPTCSFNLSPQTVQMGDEFILKGSIDGQGDIITSVTVTLIGPNERIYGEPIFRTHGEYKTFDLDKTVEFVWGDKVASYWGDGFVDTSEPAVYWIQIEITTRGNSNFYKEVIKEFTLKESEIETVNLKYNVYPGKNAPHNLMIKKGEIFVVPSNIPTREGYKFLGWADDISKREIGYVPGSSFKINQSTTLYAIWAEADKSVVSYNCDGGFPVPLSKAHDNGALHEITSVIPEKDGYDFLGWSLEQSAENVAYQSDDRITVDDDIKLYAVWKQKEETIKDIFNHWSEKSVRYVVDNGIIDLEADGIFNPDGAMTRGKFVIAIARMSGVDNDHIAWAQKMGILLGDGTGDLKLDNTVNRAEMCTFLYRYLKNYGYNIVELEKKDLSLFSDHSLLEKPDWSWSLEYVYSMQKIGIVQGKLNNAFDPAGFMTRAECAAVIYNMYNAVKAK